MRKLKATEVVVDFMLYPRGDVNSHNVSYLVRALEAGYKLPPIVVDQKSRRIVDGVHRWNAHRKFTGKEDCEIECELRSYKNDAEMFLDSARRNAKHGVSLSTFDRVKCILRAAELGIGTDDIADALCMTVEKVGNLHAERSGRLRSATPAKGLEESGEVPLKRTIRHMAGKVLTRHQAEVNEKLSGMDPLFYVNQLLLLIESDLIDVSNEKLLRELDRLLKAARSLMAKI